MKKCLVVALGCLVSFAARADMFVDITVARAGQEIETKSFAMNEVALFQDEQAGVSAQLVATEQDGAVCITAQCTRVQNTGETVCDELPTMVLAFDEVVTLVKTEDVTVTIVARTTDVKAVDCPEEATMQATEEVVATPDETTKTPEETVVEVLVVEEVVAAAETVA